VQSAPSGVSTESWELQKLPVGHSCTRAFLNSSLDRQETANTRLPAAVFACSKADIPAGSAALLVLIQVASATMPDG